MELNPFNLAHAFSCFKDWMTEWNTLPKMVVANRFQSYADQLRNLAFVDWVSGSREGKTNGSLAQLRCKMRLVDGSEAVTPIQGRVQSIQVCTHDCQHGHCARMTHTHIRDSAQLHFQFMHVKDMDFTSGPWFNEKGRRCTRWFCTFVRTLVQMKF